MLAHPPYHQQQPSSQPQTVSPTTTVLNPDPATATTQTQPQPAQPQPPGTFQTLRLRDDPPLVTHPAPRTSRKRKSPATSSTEAPQTAPPPPGTMHPPPPGMPGHPIPPMVHPSHMGPPIPHGYQYVPNDYTTGGIPPPPVQTSPMQTDSPGDGQGSAAGRTLSQSKRAEQNRKAQRAFRERRDQHVKALESRSQLLDAALASADEANRRWEECRALVDQLRIENAALRAALSAAQLVNGPGTTNGADPASAPPPNQEQTNQGNNDASGGGASGEINKETTEGSS